MRVPTWAKTACQTQAGDFTFILYDMQAVGVVRKPLEQSAPVHGSHVQIFPAGRMVADKLYLADTNPDSALAPLPVAACTYHSALEPQAGQKVLTLPTVPRPAVQSTEQRCVNAQRFSLHTEVHCAINQRHKLEHLCRSITHPASANERLILKRLVWLMAYPSIKLANAKRGRPSGSLKQLQKLCNATVADRRVAKPLRA